jgi:VanZ family protein
MRIFAATALATLYGVSDEIHQMFVPPRTPDWRDICADAFGALTGAVVVAVAAKLLSRTRWHARYRGT